MTETLATELTPHLARMAAAEGKVWVVRKLPCGLEIEVLVAPPGPVDRPER